MLLKLTGDQISRFWPVIKDCVSESLPTYYTVNDKILNNYLRELLIGNRHCWVEVDQNNNSKLRFIITASVVDEPVFEQRHFNWDSIKRYTDEESPKVLSGIVIKLYEWSQSRGCTDMIAVTKNQSILNLADDFGVDTSNTFMVLPIKEG